MILGLLKYRRLPNTVLRYTKSFAISGITCMQLSPRVSRVVIVSFFTAYAQVHIIIPSCPGTSDKEKNRKRNS